MEAERQEMLEQGQARSGARSLTIHPMEYRAILADGIASPPPAEAEEASTAKVDRWEERLRELQRETAERAESVQRDLQVARAEAHEAGRASERTDQAMRLQAAGSALTEALEKFVADRDCYMAQVEREVVKLALAIAARVLRRETLMDPLLLSGAVRVALGQLAETSEVRLKVPAADHAMWTEMLRLMPNLPLQPEVVADEMLTTGDCLLEAQVGSVDLGVKSQLAEIERGFFDLLERRETQGSRREVQPPPGGQRIENRGGAAASAE